ncbi:MAG: RHS repeat protein [Candidatus Riflebacteria bacterium]|nr:RHS repeat protein [Candidatus Riflebacteria bacterium]
MSGGLSLLTTDVPLLLMGPEPQRVGTVPLTQGATHLDLSPEVLSQFWSALLQPGYLAVCVPGTNPWTSSNGAANPLPYVLCEKLAIADIRPWLTEDTLGPSVLHSGPLGTPGTLPSTGLGLAVSFVNAPAAAVTVYATPLSATASDPFGESTTPTFPETLTAPLAAGSTEVRFRFPPEWMGPNTQVVLGFSCAGNEVPLRDSTSQHAPASGLTRAKALVTRTSPVWLEARGSSAAQNEKTLCGGDDASPETGVPAPDSSEPKRPPGANTRCTAAACQGHAHGSPVIAKTGEVVLTYTDLEAPSRGISFQFQRFYSSVNRELGPMGRGWTRSFSWPLTETTRLDGTVFVDVGTESGLVVQFFKPYHTSSFASLTSSAPNFELSVSADGAYTLTRRLNESVPLQYVYDPEHRLVRIHRDPDYDLQLGYDGNPPQSQPKVIVDTQGRTYTLGYTLATETDWALSSLTSNRSGRTIYYRYLSGAPILAMVDDSSLPSSPQVTSQMYFYGAAVPEPLEGAVHLVWLASRSGSLLLQVDYDPQTGRVVGLMENGISHTLSYDQAACQMTKTGQDGSVAITSYTGPDGALLAWQGPGSTVLRREYGPDRALVATVDAAGERTRYLQSSNSLTISDPEGRESRYEWLPEGPITRIVDPLHHQTQLSYDSRQRLLGLVDPRGFAWTYSNDDCCDRIASMVTPLGHATSWSYDGHGNLTRETLPDGTFTQILYGADDLPTALVDPRGYTLALDTDTAGRVRLVSDAEGRPTTFSHDVEGRVATVRNPLGHLTSLFYDSYSRLARVVGPDGHTAKTVQYFDALHKRVETDARGYPTEWRYDPETRVRTIAYPDETTARVTYDGDARPVIVRNGRGFDSFLRYDRAARLQEVETPDGLRTRFVLDDAGRCREVREAYGTASERRTGYDYEPDGLVRRIDHADGSYVRFEYDDDGNRTLVATPTRSGAEALTRYVYDSRRRVTEIHSADASVTRVVYDAVSNVRELTTAHGTAEARTTSYLYSPAGHLTSVTMPAGSVTSYEYDDAGRRTARVVASNDPAAAVRTEYDRDVYGRVVSVREAVDRAEARTLSLGYDDAGNLIRLTNGRGKSWQFGYDPRNRLNSQADPLGRQTTLGHDGNGNVAWTVLPGGERIETGYDGMDRPVQTVYKRADGSIERTVVTAYDLFGNPTSVTGAGTVLTQAFDVRDRVVAFSQSQLGSSLRQEYDLAGDVRATTLSVGQLPGVTLSYVWDVMHRLRVVDAGQGRHVDFNYNLNGQRSSVGHANGTHASYGYDPAGRIASIDYWNSGGTHLTHLGLTYDARGNVIAAQHDAANSSFTPDALDRLILAAYDDGSRESFSYDGADNRTRHVTTPATGPATVDTYTVDDADTIVRIDRSGGPSTVLTYTPNGQLSREQVGGTTPTTYSWSVSGQLRGITRSDGATLAFSCLPAAAGNLRWRATVASRETRTLWSPDGNPLAELDAANHVTRLHLHGEGLDDFLGHVDPATGDWLSLPVSDHLGSVRALVTLTGAVLATQSFAAYGQLRGPPAPAALGSFGFTGRDGVEVLRITDLGAE